MNVVSFELQNRYTNAQEEPSSGHYIWNTQSMPEQLHRFDCHGIQDRNAEGEALHHRLHLRDNHHSVAVDQHKEVAEGRTRRYL